MLSLPNAQLFPSEYVQIQQRAMENSIWLTANLDKFSPSRDGHIDFFHLKAFAEFSLVCAYLEQWKYLGLDKHLASWHAFIIEHCENPIYAQGPRKQPAMAFAYLVPYLMLRSVGYQSSYYEETLKRLRFGLLHREELVPYRVLDRQYMFWKSGYIGAEPRWHRLYRTTALGKCRSPLYLSDEAAYSVTHTLFYVTDFGNRSTIFPSKEIRRIKAITECLLLHYWRVGHWDLVGELLCNLNCLDSTNSAVYSGAATAFDRAQQSDGSVPAKRDLVDLQKPSQGQEEEEERKFRNCYHTTLVGVLCRATAMNRIIRWSGEESCPV